MPSATLPNDLWFDLETLISTAQPNSVAIFGDTPEEFLQGYAEQRALLQSPLQQIRLPGEAILSFNESVDVAILINPFADLERQECAPIIGRVRDVISRQFCLCVPLDSGDGQGWQLSELLALGLRRVARYQGDKQHFGLFSFSLRDYKQTPDWLNADNWANPEMWGKYWW